jgi:hypothetical protein
VNLVRMDIEGHEVQILSSLAAALEEKRISDRAPDAFIFEPHSWEYGVGQDNEMLPILKRLTRFGYRISMLGTRDAPTCPLRMRGYKPLKLISEKRGLLRSVYEDFDQKEAMELVAMVDGVTTVCLQRL